MSFRVQLINMGTRAAACEYFWRKKELMAGIEVKKMADVKEKKKKEK
jgi:hypothetical protein